MRKNLSITLAVLFIASCSTIKPIAGATGKVGSKTGEAKQAFICGFPAKGEGGIYQAAKQGGITAVGIVDVRYDYPANPVFAAFYYVDKKKKSFVSTETLSRQIEEAFGK